MKFPAFLFIIALLLPELRGQDPGMQTIGTFSVKLIFATNGDPTAGGAFTKEVSEEEAERLHAITKLDFKEYRLMGVDTPDILKGYENWATPLRPSKEILVSFQPIKRSGDDQVQMVLEYWQSKRKIFSVNPTLTLGKTLYLMGPAWRGGRLVMAVKIEELKK
jgi:hypothetical protein